MGEYTIEFNHNVDFETAVTDSGCYWANMNIIPRESLPRYIPSHGMLEANKRCRLVSFGRTTRTWEIKKHLKDMNLRSATLLELLAFAAKYPNEQQEGSPIIALDGYYDHRGFHRVPYLEKSWDQLLLDFCYGTPIGGWNRCCRFLVVEMKGKS